MDTDACSLMFKKRLPPGLETKILSKIPAMTFVTCGEMTEWSTSHRWGDFRRRELLLWMKGFAVLPGSRSTAEIFGVLRAAAKARGRPRPINDTWIAACCLSRHVPLATLNVKDFEDFAEYHGLVLITV
jgi:predicted nucleic acid-binding protein